MDITKERERVKKKILRGCKEYNIAPPRLWYRGDVERVANEINKAVEEDGWDYSIIHCCSRCNSVDIIRNHKCDFTQMENREMSEHAYW